MTILQEYAQDLKHQHSVNPDLQNALTSYLFPPALAARLQQKQGWNEAFTLRALEEYCRFVQLAVVSPTQVTPSQVVDEVWHTHLMFTRDYWERFMPLLPAPLHHEPGDGGAGDDLRFAGQYRQTREAYRATFGQEPPPEFWPDPQQHRPSTAKRSRGGWTTVLVLLIALGTFLLFHSVFAAFFILIMGIIVLTSLSGTQANPSSAGGGSCGGGIFTFSDGEPSTDSGCGDSGSSCGSSCGAGCGGGCGGGCGS